MKKFTVPCDFGGKKIPFPVYIGEPHAESHPLRFQHQWIAQERGGVIPTEVMDSFQKLHKISLENNVSFEDLCVYAMGEANKQNAEALPSSSSESASSQPSDTEDVERGEPSAS